MKQFYIHKKFARDNYRVVDGKIEYNKEDSELYLCSEKGNTYSIDKDGFISIVQKLDKLEVVTLKVGVPNAYCDYSNILQQLDDKCRDILGNHYIIELNIITITKKTYMTNRNIFEDYFLGRYELYVSVNDIDEYGKDFCLFEYSDGFLNNIEKITENFGMQLNKLRQGRELRRKPFVLKDGKYPCVLSNYFASSIIHECIGHLSEMDIYKKYILGKTERNYYECLSDIVIRDIGNDDKQSGLIPVPMNYDDEGNECRNIKIFCNKRFNVQLTDELVAAREKILNTGNARFGYLKMQKMIRMRNTYIEAGQNTLDELIKSINKGLYLVYPDLACVLPNSHFEMKVLTGYWIENGRITSPIETVYVHSYTRKLLESISMISNNFKWYGSRCFKKGEEVYVGVGSPEMKVDLFVTHESTIESLLKGTKIYEK